MNDKVYPRTSQDLTTAMQRNGPLSISTSRTKEGDGTGQSTAIHSALPQSPHRTVSEPMSSPSSSEYSSATRATTYDVPSSAGYGEKSLKFNGGSPTSPRRPLGEKPSRRHSHDPSKVNVHTECGRHGDDWLFGGWTVSGAVRKLWDKDTKQ